MQNSSNGNNSNQQDIISTSISKALLPMQSLDALLQSSHMQSNILAHQQYRQNQVGLIKILHISIGIIT